MAAAWRRGETGVGDVGEGVASGKCATLVAFTAKPGHKQTLLPPGYSPGVGLTPGGPGLPGPDGGDLPPPSLKKKGMPYQSVRVAEGGQAAGRAYKKKFAQKFPYKPI